MTERDWRCEDPKQQLVWAAATGEALRVLEGKWKIVIIVQLFAAKAPVRFSERERRVEGVNQKMLIQQLKELRRTASSPGRSIRRCRRRLSMRSARWAWRSDLP